MKLIYLLLPVGLFVACNSPEEDAGKTGEKKADSTTQSPLNCYRYATETDTVLLKLIQIENSITGILVYKFREKDKNEGTILGSMEGDLLVADYTFMSEGIQSTRQIAFKLQGNTFVEGYGESIERDGKIFFKNLDSLDFSTSIKLAEYPCQQ